MNRIHLSAAALLAALVLVCSARQARAISNDFTFGNFENLTYVGYQTSTTYGGADPVDTYNLSVLTNGYINNGPITNTYSPATGPGHPSPYDPSTPWPSNPAAPPPGYTVPTAVPIGANDKQSVNGNWNQIYNTGFWDWNYPNLAHFGQSTTTGVTQGSKAIVMDPNIFGANSFSQHLSIKVQSIGAIPAGNTQLTRDTTTSDADYANIQSHKYMAVDVTFKSSDWTFSTLNFGGAAGTAGAAGAVQVTADINAGMIGGVGVFSDRTGFQQLGQYVENTANPATAIARPSDVDSRRALLGGTNGVYDPGNHTGTYTTTLYWDYSHWQDIPTQPGGPATNFYRDLRTYFSDTTKTSGSNGYTEFVIETGYDTGYTGGKFYFDNWRVTNNVLRLGDFDNNGHINAADIKPMEAALANPSSYLASPTGLSGLTLNAGDLVTMGDVNGDGVFNNGDLQAFLTDLKAGLGSETAVPEPAALVLLGLAAPALLMAARRNRKSMA